MVASFHFLFLFTRMRTHNGYYRFLFPTHSVVIGLVSLLLGVRNLNELKSCTFIILFLFTFGMPHDFL